jgi:membrane-bound metal-dependent hydrolase YbcI (DUF457 family)
MTGQTHLLGGCLAASVALQAADAPPEAWLPGLVLGAIAGIVPDVDTPDSLFARLIPGYPEIHRGAAGRFFTVLALCVALPLYLAGRFPAWLDYLPGPLRSGVTWAQGVIPHTWLVVLPLLALGFSLISRLLQTLVRHRGVTHSLLLVGVLAYLGHLGTRQGLLEPWTSQAFLAGYVSHLVLDALTAEAVPGLLWPFSKAAVGLARVPLLGWLACKSGDAGERFLWRPALLLALAGYLTWRWQEELVALAGWLGVR